MFEWRVSLGLSILLRPTAQRSAVHLISFVPALYSHGIRALCFGYAPDRCYMGYTMYKQIRWTRSVTPAYANLALKWRCLPRWVQLEHLPWRQLVLYIDESLEMMMMMKNFAPGSRGLFWKRSTYYNHPWFGIQRQSTSFLVQELGMREIQIIWRPECDSTVPPIRYLHYTPGDRLMAQGNQRIIIRFIIDNYKSKKQLWLCEYGRPVPSRFGDPMVYARKRMQLYRWSSRCKQ